MDKKFDFLRNVFGSHTSVARTLGVTQRTYGNYRAGKPIPPMAKRLIDCILREQGYPEDKSAVTGLISIGDTVSGTGITAGTTIVSQVSGTTGGAGTYVLSAANTCSAATVTSFGTVLNVSAVGSGTLYVGDPVSGTGIPTGASISGQVSGATGGVGVYTLDVAATAYAASTTVTVTGGVLTSWKCKSIAAPGELVKISTWL